MAEPCTRPKVSRREIWPLQLRHRLWKTVASSQHDAAGCIETAHQRRQRNSRPDTAAAIAATLEAVAGRDDEWIGIGHPTCKLADIIGFDAAFGRGLVQRPLVRPRHEGVIAEQVLVDERAVMGADAL